MKYHKLYENWNRHLEEEQIQLEEDYWSEAKELPQSAEETIAAIKRMNSAEQKCLLDHDGDPEDQKDFCTRFRKNAEILRKHLKTLQPLKEKAPPGRE